MEAEGIITMQRFAGIKRNVKFSPNHRGNDSAIFNLTVDRLKEMGHEVNVYSEEELLAAETLSEDCVFSMARSKKLVKKLQKLQKEKLVINSAFGVEQCFRTNMTKKLISNGVPYPKSVIVPTENPGEELFAQLGSNGFWLKRGDFHAIHKEDVSFAPGVACGIEILKEFQLRSIGEAVISEHLYGDLVKFYGVKDSGFFYWFYPAEFNHSKFNAEAINGAAHYYKFDEEVLKQHCTKAAEALDVHIYGGDAVIAPDGRMHIIDFNDWPSFAPCRDEAAIHIAQCIHREAAKLVAANGGQ